MYDPKPKCRDSDSIDFLIASPKAFCCTEAAAVQPESPDAPAHAAFTRLRHRLEPDPAELWIEARPMVQLLGGLLVRDDSTLDQHDAKKIDRVGRHGSGKHKRVVRGINRIPIVWTDGDRVVPCDYRLYDKATDGLTKNDHCLVMLQEAKARDCAPRCGAFDRWYSGLENRKAVRSYGGTCLTQLKVNRKVDRDRQGYRAVAATAIAPGGTIVHLEGFGSIRVFKVVSRDGDLEDWATTDLAMDERTRLAHAEQCWGIANYHRGLKQCGGVARAQVRAGRAQRNHIGLAIRAFLRLEHHCSTTGVSWYEAKARIIRGAVRAYIANPVYNLP